MSEWRNAHAYANYKRVMLRSVWGLNKRMTLLLMTNQIQRIACNKLNKASRQTDGCTMFHKERNKKFWNVNNLTPFCNSSFIIMPPHGCTCMLQPLEYTYVSIILGCNLCCCFYLLCFCCIERRHFIDYIWQQLELPIDDLSDWLTLILMCCFNTFEFLESNLWHRES